MEFRYKRGVAYSLCFELRRYYIRSKEKSPTTKARTPLSSFVLSPFRVFVMGLVFLG
jgi:hypothetical protein